MPDTDSLSTSPRWQSLDAIMFDFDGTLAPNLDLPAMRQQVIQLTLDTGVPERVFADKFIVEIVHAAVDWLATHDTHNSRKSDDYRAEAEALIIAIEVNAAANTQPFAAVPGLLAELRTRGIKLGVITRNCRAAITTIFPDVHTACDVVLARDDATHLKPDVRHLQQALDMCGCTGERAAMVGDGAMDMQIGAALGAHCIGVLTGSANKRRLKLAGAHAVLPAIGDLAHHLQLGQVEPGQG